MNPAPHTALGRDQHDIASKRLKVDLVLPAAARVARDIETLPSQAWSDGRPCPARTAQMHYEQKTTGCRPTVATGIFRIIDSRANEPRSAYCVGTIKRAANTKRPAFNPHLFPKVRVELKT
jgi:hypothetical protein